MKNKILILLLSLFATFCHDAQAAFWIKRAPVVAGYTAATDTIHHTHKPHKKPLKKQDTGLASLIGSAIAAFTLFGLGSYGLGLLFSLAGVILGGIGLKKKHHTLAIIGFALGIIVLVISLYGIYIDMLWGVVF